MTPWASLPDNPKISVVTVSFNQGEFIRQNIESVLAQNYPNFEHIVIDGGSTDGTLEILRSYPHLKWTSEPDRNQSHALNKGFAKASGEIIAWLNSDDWYAPNVFHEIAHGLKNHGVLLTQAAETDRYGKVKQVVENYPRTFFDLLRYWVPYAWLAQTGVFFRRSLLEQVKSGDTEYLSEDLHFTMDIDLWFRLALQSDFTNHLDKVCAYFRMWEENKTGKSPLSAQKECGRIFRKTINQLSLAERELSFVMPLNQIATPLTQTLNSLLRQSVSSFDLLIVDYSSTPQDTEAIKHIVEEFEKSVNSIGVRYLRVKTTNALEALNTGLLRACSPLVATAWPGDIFGPDFVASALNVFSVDPTGIALPVKDRSDLRRSLYDEKTLRLRFDGLLTDCEIPLSFVARQAALLESSGIDTSAFPALCIRELLLSMQAKGWYVSTSNELEVKVESKEAQSEKEVTSVFLDYMNARLINLLSELVASDVFAPVRQAHAWCQSLPPTAADTATRVLALAPSNWQTLQFVDDLSALQAIVASHPSFKPAWFFLEKKCRQMGLLDQATAAAKKCQELR